MFPPGFASRGSFKRQIILTFVVGFFALATAFAVYMVKSERASLYRDSANATTGLAQSLAVSSISWVLANDVVGLQEVVQSFRDYPELRYAMVISPTGRVMAHSDAAKVGQFVADEQSLALVKADPAKRVMRDDESVIDVAVPIEMGKRHVGWARIGLGRESIAGNLRKMIWNVTFFVILATALSLLAAVLVVNRLGRRIGSLVTVAQEVQAGNFAMRVKRIPGKEDEITRLASSLNLMLDAQARNEERLRAASLYTRSLIEASLDPLVTISPEGKITDVNHATEMATGRSRDELVGTDFSEYFTEPDRAREGYRKVFAQGEVTDYPLAIRHRDGHVTEVLYNASIYRNEGGAVQGVFAAARDVSGQQRAELLQAQLAAIVESSSDAIIGKTLEGIITSWNKGAEKIYGYHAEEVIGQPVTLLASAEQHAEMHRLLETARSGGTVENHEAERMRKDGTRIHVALTLSPIRDAFGKISGISTIARDITARKQSEEQIKQSETKYRTLIQNIQAAVVVHGGDTRILIFNSMAQEILGLSDDQLIGKSAIDPAWHFFREDGKAAEPDEYPVNRVLATRQPLRNLVLGVHRPGLENDVWVLVNADPVFDMSGEIAQVIITFIDITERKQVETNLKRMNERFALATRAANLGVWDWDIPKNELVWDDRMYALYGIKREDFAGAYDAWLKGIHPDDRIHGDEAIQMALRGEGEFDTEFRVLWPDGSVHTLKAFGRIVRDADGTPLRMTGINFDITERKQAEEALRASRDEYRRTLDNMMEGCQILGFDWRFLYVNDAVAKHGRRAKEEMLGHTMFELYPGIEKSEMFAELRHCMDSRMSVHTDTEFAYPDGSKSYFQLSIQPVPEGIFILSMDITERKQAEEALRREQTLLNRIMVTSPVGIAVVNKEGQITFANPQAEKILGLSKEKITQLSYNAPEWHSTAIDGSPFPDEAQPFSLVMATRQPVFDVQHAIAWPDGRRVLLSINGAPLFDAQGEIEGVAFAIEDITERKLADETLRLSEQSLAESQRIAHLGSWHVDLATNQVFWSEELYRMYGFDPALPPPLYTESMKLFTPESWERLSSAISRAVETGAPYELELETVNRDGSGGWMQARGEPVRDEHGKAVGVRGVVMDITGRKQAEEKLRRSEHGLSEAQRIAHLGNWELDLVKNVLTWSDEIYRIFEIDPEKFGASYEAFLNAIHPEDRDMVNQAYNDSVKNKVPYDIVHRLLMPDGRIKYVNEKCETYYGADGKPLNSFGTVHDITERILDQQALLRLNRELRAISNCNLVLMRAEDEQTLLDNICRIVCDEAGYRMAWVGYPENDEAKTIRPVAWAGVEDGYLAQAGITWADTERGRGPSGIAIRSGKSACFQDISTDLLAAPWRESAMQRGYRSSISLPLKDENANTFGILTIYSTEPNAFTPEEIRLLEELAGDLAFGIVTLRTRAERKQAEQALRVERGLFVAGPSVVFKWRAQEGWPVEYVSPNVLNQFGYAPEDLISGKVQYASIVHPDDIARVGNEVSTYNKQGAASFEQMYRIAGADGRYRWIEDFTTVIRGLDGAITHYLGYLQDITERKQAEEEIRTLNHELEQRVAARTADLEAANQELESFSYSVSHDLRTPLRAIDGFSHILLDDYADKLDEEGKRLLNVVRNNTGRMGQLIDDILKFSRAGRLEINYSEIDMEQLAFSVFVELRPVVAGDKLQMEIEHIPPARGDSAMMRQVFVNLLSNAIKFSATKEAPQIQVGATVKDDETIYYVKDNGAGFDMQYSNKLFGVFQRLHGVTEFEGTGIGLAIVKRIVARHGGRVWAEGKVGEGATFYFTLPQAEHRNE